MSLAARPPRRIVSGPKENAILEFDDLDLDGARVIARVGTEVIQEIEVKAYVNDIIEANGAKINRRSWRRCARN